MGGTTLIIMTLLCAKYDTVLVDFLPLFTQSTSVVTIALNDNADGVFTVSSARITYTITESSDDVITITILRELGALTTQTIEYQTVPGSGADFIGSVGREIFSPGQTEAIVHIIPLDDDVPEETEEFNFTISASNSDFLGDTTFIGITILANDEHAGLFSFTDTSLELTIGKLIHELHEFLVQPDASICIYCSL